MTRDTKSTKGPSTQGSRSKELPKLPEVLTRQEIVMHAEQAAALLGSPVYVVATRAVLDQLAEAFMQTKPYAQKERDWLHAQRMAQGIFHTKLMEFVQAARMLSAQELEARHREIEEKRLSEGFGGPFYGDSVDPQ